MKLGFARYRCRGLCGRTFLAFTVWTVCVGPSTPRVPAQFAARPSPTSITALIEKKNLDDAETQLWGILTRNPDEIWALKLMAKVRVLQGREPEAEALYRRVQTLQPQDVQTNRALGDLYRAQGKRIEAVQAYSRIVATKPNDLHANQSLAELYADAGDYEKSLSAVG